MHRKFALIALGAGLTAGHAAPAAKPAPSTKAAAKKPRQHSKTIKRLEEYLGRKLSDAEKAKVRAARDVYDRDLARAVGLTAEQLDAKTKAFKAAHPDAKDDDKDGKR